MTARELGHFVIRRALLAAEGRPPRTLVVFANPLGNALGDIAIATQHIPFLGAVPRNQVTVWTANSDIWESLCGENVVTRALISPKDLTTFDIILIDWVNSGAGFLQAVDSTDAIVLYWKSRNLDLEVRHKGASIGKVHLPPTANHPVRIPDLYAALDWHRTGELPASMGGATRRRGVYFNPYASTPTKSITPPVASILAEELLRTLRSSTPIIVGPQPIPLSAGDAAEFEKIATAIDTPTSTFERMAAGQCSIGKYVQIVKSSLCTISPDTSTQHIAAITKTPCIVLYQGSRAFNHYAFGWPEAESYAFAMYNSHESRESLVRVVSVLVATLCGLEGYEVRDLDRLRSAAISLKELLIEQAQRPVFGLHFTNVLTEAVFALEQKLPRSWAPCLLPELRQAAAEIADPSVLERIDMGSLRRRIDMISCLRTIERLSTR
jgi:hypothetical protein